MICVWVQQHERRLCRHEGCNCVPCGTHLHQHVTLDAPQSRWIGCRVRRHQAVLQQYGKVRIATHIDEWLSVPYTIQFPPEHTSEQCLHLHLQRCAGSCTCTRVVPQATHARRERHCSHLLVCLMCLQHHHNNNNNHNNNLRSAGLHFRRASSRRHACATNTPSRHSSFAARIVRPGEEGDGRLTVR